MRTSVFMAMLSVALLSTTVLAGDEVASAGRIGVKGWICKQKPQAA